MQGVVLHRNPSDSVTGCHSISNPLLFTCHMVRPTNNEQFVWYDSHPNEQYGFVATVYIGYSCNIQLTHRLTLPFFSSNVRFPPETLSVRLQ